MKKVYLSGNHTDKYALIDDEDWGLVSQHKWYLNKKAYAITGDGVLMHRMIMKAKRGEEVDHIHGNRLDNRKTELRFCNPSQQHANERVSKNNTSGYKGVRYFKWGKRIKRWQARIMVNRKQMDLGYFNSKIEAAHVYNEAAIKHFGEFAKLNIV